MTTATGARVGIAVAIVAVLAMLSSMALFGCLEVKADSTEAIEVFRSLIFPDTPSGEASFRPPSLFSDSHVLLEWAAANGATSLACLTIAIRRGATVPDSRSGAVTVVTSLLSLASLVVLGPIC